MVWHEVTRPIEDPTLIQGELDRRLNAASASAADPAPRGSPTRVDAAYRPVMRELFGRLPGSLTTGKSLEKESWRDRQRFCDFKQKAGVNSGGTRFKLLQLIVRYADRDG